MRTNPTRGSGWIGSDPFYRVEVRSMLSSTLPQKSDVGLGTVSTGSGSDLVNDGSQESLGISHADH